MKRLPSCTVVVLNYNGKRLIKAVLENLNALHYPKDKYEIVVVDNKSTDGSEKIIEDFARLHTNVIFIQSDRNGGFAYGNNLAINRSRNKYVALVNNDCFVSRNWLKELVAVAEKHPECFAINSKIILYPKYTFLTTSRFEVINPSIIGSKLLEHHNQKSIQLIETPLNDKSVMAVFSDPNDEEVVISFQLCLPKETLPKSIDFSPIGSREIIQARYTKNYTYKLVVPSSILRKHRKDLIQNCGSIVFQDGYGRDIGACVVPGIQNYEVDKGQYDQVKEVFACCGASCLYRRYVLKKIGGFDDTFFMYYEDTELSWRARIHGYVNYRAPRSVARHFHSMSSQEGSELFVFNAEYGRLLSLYYSAPTSVFRKEILSFFARASVQYLRSIVKNNRFDAINLRVLIKFVYTIASRGEHKKKKYASLHDRDVRKELIYNQILEGKWYRE